MQSIRFLLLVLLTALLAPLAAAAPAPDYAGQLKHAYSLLASGDYSRAYSAFQRQAAANPLAQFTLGQFHQNGWGRPVDRDAACAWFAKAAGRKVPTALHYHGDCLMRTPDAPGHAASALASYLAAADNGHKISLCMAAEFYIRGRYVASDVAHGLALCAAAAQANSPPAMLRLAQYLQHDANVPVDLAGARHWYRLAAERNVSEARYQLAIMQSQGDGGAVDVEAALAGMESLAAEGHVAAYLPTAVLYAHQPPQPDSGALSAEHLAKTYLWASAAKASLPPDSALAAAAEQLLTSVLAVMPADWRPALDARVATHLAKFALPRANGASPGV
ncbi:MULTISPECIES: tetratricopeptide repeat protein [unclassified Duganella]|uniref:tetratricopeptide repeat protein n=1 Tax=unclassified Duganella TaxID=2636909 RepID=UPI0011134A9E|nr:MULTISPECIES: SEL1-like repeat protein [unclassified Duganella]